MTGSSVKDKDPPALLLEGLCLLKNFSQPAQGEKESGGGAEGREEEDQQDAGHAISPPAADSHDIITDVFEIVDRRGDNPGLGQSGKEADTEGGVEGGDRSGHKGGEDR